MITIDDITLVKEYLVEKYYKGNRYHKARDIGRELSIPTKKIPGILKEIQDKNGIIMEKWSKHSYRVVGVN